ncbi:MAG: hypothetical protein HQL22_11565 [Candidatus Omnitrophica bacterium]|nr:hypothetical protein [Candidatus Omnitrophota bacterium]
MKITIEQAVNGYVITYPDYITQMDGTEKEVFKNSVIEEKEDDEKYGEQEAFVALCWRIHELFGIRWESHSPRKLCIELREEKDEDQ